jgi:sodium/hydrogen exchanger-like protein 6/7
MVFRDGQWFTALDERYLLPLFSNSVASRRHQAKKLNKRAASVYNGGDGSPQSQHRASMDQEGDDVNDGDSESGKGKPSRNFRSV